jgi:hypothetical protein
MMEDTRNEELQQLKDQIVGLQHFVQCELLDLKTFVKDFLAQVDDNSSTTEQDVVDLS